MANAQLQAKNTELQDAISGLKKNIAMGQSLMMQEIRAMREESRAMRTDLDFACIILFVFNDVAIADADNR